MSFLFEISLIVILIGFANSSIGVFLVLNDKSMISFALSHAILLGIIISYNIIPDLYSPIFIIISAIIGFIIVSIVELLNKVKFIEYNSALGFVYLTVFAISIILISTNELDIYYSLESIVSGQLLYLPFFRTTFLGINLPSIAWTMISLIILNIVFIILTWKELLITSFDPLYAQLNGFSTQLITMFILLLSSMTIVGSYNAVGPLLVISFIVTPPAISFLYSNDLKQIFFLTFPVQIFCSLIGVQIAFFFDISPAGVIACTFGFFFLLSLFLAPNSNLKKYLFSKSNKVDMPKNITYDHLDDHKTPVIE